MKQSRFWAIIGLLSAVGLALRVWLAFFIFPNQGFAWDLATFASWMDTIENFGWLAYEIDPGINYPPVFADLLACLIWIGNSLGIPPIDLIKWPSILADIGIALLLAQMGQKWFSKRVAIFAAAAFLFLPVTWYDSAIWGQVDSLSALPMLLAIYLLIDKKPEWAAVFFVIAVLTKPQGALILLILLPVFLGQLSRSELSWWRAASTSISGIATFALISLPWSMESYAPSDVADIPILGDLLGLAGQYFSTADLFPVLTANAYNIWALAGKIPMAEQFQEGRVYWLPDSYEVFGIPAGILGAAMFIAVAILIFWKLLQNSSPNIVLTATSLLLVAFFALPTRVHERYLVQAFAFLVLVWGPQLWQKVCLIILAVANTVNLHAILAANLFVETIAVRSESAAGLGIFPIAESIVLKSATQPPEFYGLSWVRMEADWAREPWIVLTVIMIHTAAFIAILIQFLVQSRKARI